MTNPSDLALNAPRSRSPGLLRRMVSLAILLPVVKWAQSAVFPDADRVTWGPVWVSFAAVLAVAGACIGAASHAAGPRRWLHSYVFGVMLALFTRAEIQQFAGMPLHTWLLRWVLSSLGMGIVAGAIYHVIVWGGKTD